MLPLKISLYLLVGLAFVVADDRIEEIAEDSSYYKSSLKPISKIPRVIQPVHKIPRPVPRPIFIQTLNSIPGTTGAEVPDPVINPTPGPLTENQPYSPKNFTFSRPPLGFRPTTYPSSKPATLKPGTTVPEVPDLVINPRPGPLTGNQPYNPKNFSFSRQPLGSRPTTYPSSKPSTPEPETTIPEVPDIIITPTPDPLDGNHPYSPKNFTCSCPPLSSLPITYPSSKPSTPEPGTTVPEVPDIVITPTPGPLTENQSYSPKNFTFSRPPLGSRPITYPSSKPSTPEPGTTVPEVPDVVITTTADPMVGNQPYSPKNITFSRLPLGSRPITYPISKPSTPKPGTTVPKVPDVVITPTPDPLAGNHPYSPKNITLSRPPLGARPITYPSSNPPTQISPMPSSNPSTYIPNWPRPVLPSRQPIYPLVPTPANIDKEPTLKPGTTVLEVPDLVINPTPGPLTGNQPYNPKNFTFSRQPLGSRPTTYPSSKPSTPEPETTTPEMPDIIITPTPDPLDGNHPSSPKNFTFSCPPLDSRPITYPSSKPSTPEPETTVPAVPDIVITPTPGPLTGNQPYSPKNFTFSRPPLGSRPITYPISNPPTQISPLPSSNPSTYIPNRPRPGLPSRQPIYPLVPTPANVDKEPIIEPRKEHVPQPFHRPIFTARPIPRPTNVGIIVPDPILPVPDQPQPTPKPHLPPSGRYPPVKKQPDSRPPIVPKPKPTSKPTVIPIPTTPPVSVIPGNVWNMRCERENGYYARQECDSYVECNSNVATEYLCPDGLYFNPNAVWPEYPCAYPSEVQCLRKPNQQTTPTYECPRQYGHFAMKGDCSKYLLCQEGLATIMNCPPGLVYNDAISACDWPEQVPSCKPEVFRGFTCLPVPEGEDPDITINYKYGNSCTNYVACQRGSPRLLSCDDGFSFDNGVGYCVQSDLVENCAGFV